MTRPSKRELERAIDEIGGVTADDGDVHVVFRDDVTGELVDSTGEQAQLDPDAELNIVWHDSVVMSRDRAQEEGREILGPAEDAPSGRDVVRVAGCNS